MKDRNENRAGYKKSATGWIPDEWDEYTLGHACSRIMDGTHFSPQTNDGPYRYVTSKNIKFGYLDLSEDSYISEEDHAAIYRRCPVKNGQVLLTKDGAKTGNACLNYLEEEFSLLSSVSVLDGKTDLLDNKYLVHWILSPYGQLRISNELAGQAITRLTLQKIKHISLPVPPYEEQKRIAEILSTWDTAINQTRKFIAAKKNRKKALMQHLLIGKARFPGFERRKGRKNYQFFDLPADWECPKIREIANERSERNKGNKGTTVLSCSKHRGFVESSLYFGKQIFSEDTSNYKVIRHGWFGYPSNHIEEGSIGLLSNREIGIVSPIYTVFECSDKVLPEYLYAIFKTETFRHIFAVSTSASVDRRGSLRWKEFSLIRVPLPEENEQKAITAILSVANAEIEILERKLKALEQQKRGLMQKLLTGEVRVKA